MWSMIGKVEEGEGADAPAECDNCRFNGDMCHVFASKLTEFGNESGAGAGPCFRCMLSKARCSLSKPSKVHPTIKDKLAELKRLEKENAELKRRC